MVETTLKTLIERFRSKPEWQHADPAVRADAVLRLPSSEREILLALAREDADPRVRRAAVKKLPDAAVLAEIAASDADAGVRDEAEGRLAHIAAHEHDEAAARAAVGRAARGEAPRGRGEGRPPRGDAGGRHPRDHRREVPGRGGPGVRGHPHAAPRPRRGSRTARRCSPWP